MTIEKQIEREYCLILGFIFLSVITLAIGYYAMACLHKYWFSVIATQLQTSLQGLLFATPSDAAPCITN